MKFPKWAPSILITAVEQYETAAEGDGEDADQAQVLADMWRRLLTRPEMELVWPWIIKTSARLGLAEFEIHRKWGFFGHFGVTVERFYALPKLSSSAYSAEMEKIAGMASVLAAQLERFAAPGLGSNPFDSHSLLPEELQELRWNIETEQVPLYSQLTSTPIAEYLRNVERQAKLESDQQHYRLTVSRKSQDFRAYLIREVAAFFEQFEENSSPSKIAIICSVALDDADITPELVRALLRRGG